MSETLEETEVIPEVEAGAVDAEATPGSVTEPEAEATPTPAPEPEIDWGNIETLRAAAEHFERLGFTLTPAQVEALEQTQDEVPPPDPFADDYPAQLERWYEARSAKDTAPFRDYIAAQQSGQTDAAIDGLLSSVADEFKLDGVDATRLRPIADSFADEGARQFPFSGAQAAQYAARKGAEWLANERKTAGDAAVTAYRKSLGEITDSPAEPSAGGGGALTIEPRPKTYDDIIAAHVSRLGS